MVSLCRRYEVSNRKKTWWRRRRRSCADARDALTGRQNPSDCGIVGAAVPWRPNKIGAKTLGQVGKKIPSKVIDWLGFYHHFDLVHDIYDVWEVSGLATCGYYSGR